MVIDRAMELVEEIRDQGYIAEGIRIDSLEFSLCFEIMGLRFIQTVTSDVLRIISEVDPSLVAVEAFVLNTSVFRDPEDHSGTTLFLYLDFIEIPTSQQVPLGDELLN